MSAHLRAGARTPRRSPASPAFHHRRRRGARLAGSSRRSAWPVHAAQTRFSVSRNASALHVYVLVSVTCNAIIIYSHMPYVALHYCRYRIILIMCGESAAESPLHIHFNADQCSGGRGAARLPITSRRHRTALRARITHDTKWLIISFFADMFNIPSVHSV